jgi:hypothetical protein
VEYLTRQGVTDRLELVLVDHRPRSRLSVLEIDFSVVERTSLDVDD